MRAEMRIIVVAVLANGLLGGCVTEEQKLQLRGQEMQAIDRIPKAIYGSARAVIANDATKLDPYEIASDQAAARSLAEIDALAKQVAEQRQMLNQFLDAAVSAAGAAIPGSGLAVAAVNSFMASIKAAEDEAKAVAVERAAAVEARANEKVASAQEEIRNLQTELNDTEAELKTRILMETQALKDFFAQMTESQKKQFKEEFLLAAAQQGVTKEELEELKAKSPEELIGMFGGGGTLGLLALYALKRTFGQSRAQEQVNELYDDFVALKERTAVLQPSPLVPATLSPEATTRTGG